MLKHATLGARMTISRRHRLICELRREPNLSGAPLASKDFSDALSELAEEAAMGALLSDRLPLDCAAIDASVAPVFSQLGEPIVDRIEIDLVCSGGDSERYHQTFTGGPWSRWMTQQNFSLREQGIVGADEQIFLLVLALPCEQESKLELPDLLPPPIIDTTLEACGVRSIDEGELVAERPLLVNGRLVQEANQRCVEAGLNETGAAVSGRYVRLPEPLPGTTTRIVTLLSSLLFDTRHSGEPLQFHFSPAALAEAQQMCQLRGMGESVITVFHSHGWGCGDCNQKSTCGLAEAKPSLQDYRLLESLLPGKCTLMPISGRKAGAEEREPLLQIYAWRGGEMRPIRWRTYHD